MTIHVLTVVTSSGCHFCADAVAAIDAFAAEFPLRVERLAADAERGAALVVEHRAAMFPLVLIDGRFFSSGRLPRAKLRALLATGAEVA